MSDRSVPKLDRHPVVKRLSQHVALTSADLADLDTIFEDELSVRRRQDLVVPGAAYRKLGFVKSGYAVRYQMLRDGRRHILDVVLPGDIVGLPNGFYERAAYSVSAVKNLTVNICTLDDYVELCYRRPQFALALCWQTVQDATIHAERGIGLGRRTPVERVAHFLLELHARLRSAGLADAEGFASPFSQEILADILGLSSPHLNRVLQQLRSDKLITLTERNVEFLNEDALRSIAHYDPPAMAQIPARLMS